MSNKVSGMVNHIDGEIKMRNIYENKPDVKNVYHAYHRNPSQGQISFFWETDSNGKNYFIN